ncbi:MAG: regulatory protein RecX [Clostridia bacterium]|nr:regulatory protein RecX [Clostridia bacterium]
MQIVSLKKDKLHLTRLSFDDGSEALIDSDVCNESCLKVGADLSDNSLKELLEESDYRRAKSRAIWYLDRADHTEKGLYDKLIRGGFKKEAAAKVVARFIEVGLLDDCRFAENYAERLNASNYSKREILQKLTLKGVPYSVAKEVLADTDGDEQSKIKNLLEKKYQTKLQRQDGAQKVFAALVRKGFSYSEVREALKSYIEEFEE